jgi:hypothetical protein
MKRTGKKTYVVVTDDGPFYKDVFLTWSCVPAGFYTTVDYIDEVGEYDFHDTIASAIDRARDADSGTWGGWKYPMAVYEVLNFEDAFYHGEEPELIKVHDISLGR